MSLETLEDILQPEEEVAQTHSGDVSELASWPMQASAEKGTFEAAPALSDAYGRARDYLRDRAEHSSSTDKSDLAELSGNMKFLALAVVATNTPKDVEKYREIIKTLKKAGEKLTDPESEFDNMIDRLKEDVRGTTDSKTMKAKLGLTAFSGIGTMVYEANGPESALLRWWVANAHVSPVYGAVGVAGIAAGVTGRIVKEASVRNTQAIQARAQFRLDDVFKAEPEATFREVTKQRLAKLGKKIGL